MIPPTYPPLDGGQSEQTAPTMPKLPPATAIPARPMVRLVDVLAACDAAALAGDLHAVRSLLAEALRLEHERAHAATAESSEAQSSPGSGGRRQ
jgi:hypothetical protein